MIVSVAHLLRVFLLCVVSYLRYGENTCGLANAPLYVNPPPTKNQRLTRKEFASAFAHERIAAFEQNKPILPRDSSIYVSPSAVWSPSTLCQSSPFSKFDLAGLTKFLYPGDAGLFASFQAAKTQISTTGRTFLQTGAEAKTQNRMRQRAQAAALEPLGLEPLHQWNDDASLLEVSVGGAPDGFALGCFERSVTTTAKNQLMSALKKKVSCRTHAVAVCSRCALLPLLLPLALKLTAPSCASSFCRSIPSSSVL